MKALTDGEVFERHPDKNQVFNVIGKGKQLHGARSGEYLDVWQDF